MQQNIDETKESIHYITLYDTIYFQCECGSCVHIRKRHGCFGGGKFCVECGAHYYVNWNTGVLKKVDDGRVGGS